MPVAGVAVAGGHAGDPLPCLPCAPDARPIRIALRRFSSAAARARPGGCGLELPAELLVGRRTEHVEADIEDEPMTIGHDVVIRPSVSSHVRTSRQRHCGISVPDRAGPGRRARRCGRRPRPGPGDSDRGGGPLGVKASLAVSRKALNDGPLAAAELMTDLLSRLVQTQDAAEGVVSFAEKRKGDLACR